MFSIWFNVGLNMAVRWQFDFDFVFDIVTDQCYYVMEEICKVCEQNLSFAISGFICNFYVEIAYLYVEAMRDRKMIQ